MRMRYGSKRFEDVLRHGVKLGTRRFSMDNWLVVFKQTTGF